MPTWEIRVGDARTELAKIGAGSVQCAITSPPYFGLRAYGTDPQEWSDGWRGELGAEPTVALYVAHLVEVMRGVKRALRDDGVLFLNLGDSYANDTKWGGSTGGKHAGGLHGDPSIGRQKRVTGYKPKDLMGVPWRVAFALQDDGWTLRSAMPWVKRNCLSGGTVVYARTQKGDMPMTIKDMARLDPTTVKLWNGERWTQLVSVWKTPREDENVEVVLRSGETIGCTFDHRWATFRGLVAARDLSVGDILKTTRLPEPESPKRPALLPDPAIGFFVGLYIAEGCRSQGAIKIAGHTRETARLAVLRNLAEGVDGTCRVHQLDGYSAPIHMHSPVLDGILDAYVEGEGAHNKHLTTRAWQRSDDFLQSVLQGYLSGDGWHDESNHRWRLGFCKNDRWATDLRVLCARLGLSLRLHRCQHMLDGRKIPGWRGQIRFDRTDRSVNVGSFMLKEDAEIVELRRSRGRQFWDLTVEDDPHLFALASGVMTHNCMPESVRDRPASAIEYIFMLTKQPRYYWDAEAVKRQHAPPNGYKNPVARRNDAKVDASRGDFGAGINAAGRDYRRNTCDDSTSNGRNFRNADLFFDSLSLTAEDYPTAEPQPKPKTRGQSAWSAGTHMPGKSPQQDGPVGLNAGAGPDFDSLGLLLDEDGDPLALDVNPAAWKEAHFATFPPKLVEPLVKAATSERGACGRCGSPWVRVVEQKPATAAYLHYAAARSGALPSTHRGKEGRAGGFYDQESKTTGWNPTCDCGAEVVPCVVLDPFAGSGTTLSVALKLGRDAVGIELNPTFADMTRKRIADEVGAMFAHEVAPT